MRSTSGTPAVVGVATAVPIQCVTSTSGTPATVGVATVAPSQRRTSATRFSIEKCASVAFTVFPSIVAAESTTEKFEPAA